MHPVLLAGMGTEFRFLLWCTITTQMNANSERIIELFNQALTRTPDERSALLDATCGAEPALRAEVEALLGAGERAGEFLRPPPPLTPANETPGEHIGPYKLIEKIGEGGCGVVYIAQQDKPVCRQVALKIIKLGLDTEQVTARFEAERQALALMDHPNIAKVLDAGATLTGRPYFVMELVRGVKITAFCDEHNLSTEERLKLFAQVCQAIQ